MSTPYINPPESDSVTWLRDNGYAVIIWTPEELREANPTKVEDRSIELGWEVIGDMQPQEEEEEY